MPWSETCRMEERARFVLEAREGWVLVSELCTRYGISRPRRRRRQIPGAWRPPRTSPDIPNRVWTADFKGEFRLGCGRLCYPLTIVDAHSRYLLDCRGLPGTSNADARSCFERVFRAYGLPEVIRTNNGVPFSSQAVGGLSQLAVWWIRLGIQLERTRRRHPEDNGAHERMHRTLKAEATRPACRTPELQQQAFNRFRTVYNEERPHEVLELQLPASVYRPSENPMPRRLAALGYPDTFLVRRVSRHGQIRWRGSDYFLSETLRGQTVGFDFRDDGDWNIYFGPARLAVLDEGEGVLKKLGAIMTPRAYSG